MMSFRNLEIHRRYRTSDCTNIGRDFIGKLLKQSVCYYRAVGFFSSSSLIYTSRGLLNVLDHYHAGDDPVIRFVVSPKLTKEDVTAIREGYKTKKEIIEDSMLREMIEPEAVFDKERLNILCHLISMGAMDIKVAVTEITDNDIGMYHEKIGILMDEEKNVVSFEGSLNESANAFANNFESIIVSKSWDETASDCRDNIDAFDELWANSTSKVEIYSFPEAVKKALFIYKRETFNKNIERDEENFMFKELYTLPCVDKKLLPSFPFDYQGDAINEWLKNHGRGIFNMATGTGKTFTAYGAMVTLLSRFKYHMAIIIVVPYTHLVEQWAEDAPLFHINNMIIGYSDPRYKNYFEELKSSVYAFNNKSLPYFFFITTNATYSLDRVQDVLKRINGPTLFVADEAHNFGSAKLSRCLLEQFKYRLALSATIDRFRDEEGTAAVKDYFGPECINYSLERAIQEGKLTPYYYYPIRVYLTADEQEQYKELTKKLQLAMSYCSEGTVSESAQRIAIKRARLISGAQGKIETLKEEMKEHLNDSHMLVYCGTSRISGENGEEVSQIDEITEMLGIDLGMRVGRYTSKESTEERKALKARFTNGDDLQVLVAIKCLDEGVNIPSIEKAFILASSTNPREYVQRRGRVLRNSPGKEYAVIYDFVCLPMKIEDMSEYEDDTRIYKTLVHNEMTRMKEFGTHSLNSSHTDDICEEIKEAYGLYKFEPADEDELVIDINQ